MNNATDLMLFPMIMSAMTEGAAGYAMQQIRISHSKPRRGCVVGCCVCGASNVTLYKNGEGRICGRCRAVMEEGGDDAKGSPVISIQPKKNTENRIYTPRVRK